MAIDVRTPVPAPFDPQHRLHLTDVDSVGDGARQIVGVHTDPGETGRGCASHRCTRSSAAVRRKPAPDSVKKPDFQWPDA